MAANDRLVSSLFQALVIAAIAVVLWVPDVSPLPENSPGLDFLLWPVAVATVLALAFDLVFRLQRSPRLRRVLRLPEQFRPRLALSLLMARRSLRDASWLTLLVGGSVALAGTQAEPQTYYTIIVAAGAILALMAAVRTASIPFPVVDTLFPFPRYRLLALGIVSLLLQHELSYAYGFPNSPLLPALVAATGASYLGSVLHNFAGVTERWNDAGALRRTLTAEGIYLAASLAAAASLALIAWGLIGSLPSVNAAALDRWPDFLLKGWTPLHLSHLFEARHLVLGFALALGFAGRLPAGQAGIAGTPYRPMFRAAAFVVSGYLAWLVTGKLAPLGHGYSLLGATVSGGLFVVALTLALRGIVSTSHGMFANAARWLSESTSRSFFLGASIVLYGLLVRPLVYQSLWFAPVYEWLIVLAFASVPLNQLRKGIKAQVVAAGAPHAAWPNWSRHYQVSEERRDPRMTGLLVLQQRFIETGEWGRLWLYLVGLLLRNGAPTASVAAAFTPMRNCYLESVKPRLRKLNQKSARRLREAALTDTVARAEAAMSLPSTPLAALDEARLREAGAAFLQEGDGPEQLAVALTLAYWQQGADLNLASELWFPLMTLVDSPAAGSGLGAFSRSLLWRIFRGGSPAWDPVRRQSMMDRAVSHLFGEGSHRDLPVAVLHQQITVIEGRRSGPQRQLLRGASVEVLEETGGEARLRPGESLRGYFFAEGVPRELVLPSSTPTATSVQQQEGKTA